MTKKYWCKPTSDGGCGSRAVQGCRGRADEWTCMECGVVMTLEELSEYNNMSRIKKKREKYAERSGQPTITELMAQ